MNANYLSIASADAARIQKIIEDRLGELVPFKHMTAVGTTNKDLLGEGHRVTIVGPRIIIGDDFQKFKESYRESADHVIRKVVDKHIHVIVPRLCSLAGHVVDVDGVPLGSLHKMNIPGTEEHYGIASSMGEAIVPGLRSCPVYTPSWPLRFNSTDSVDPIEPLKIIQDEDGRRYSLANQEWLNAEYEGALIVRKESIERVMPLSRESKDIKPATFGKISFAQDFTCEGNYARHGGWCYMNFQARNRAAVTLVVYPRKL